MYKTAGPDERKSLLSLPIYLNRQSFDFQSAVLIRNLVAYSWKFPLQIIALCHALETRGGIACWFSYVREGKYDMPGGQERTSIQVL